MKFFAPLSFKKAGESLVVPYFLLQPSAYGQPPQPQEQEPPFLRERRVKKRAAAAATTRRAATITVAKFACNHANIYNTPPKRRTNSRTTPATIHATAHWISTTRAAQRTPSSRRIDAMAATQGV